jgi:glycosyltransferase involved in cell wall biosynthesis
MKISVCIATYNGEKYIKEQLESILKQLSIDDEVIISDDSSTDKTLEIIESFKDKRIKLYKNNNFRNPIFNFENALKYSTGDIIFLSDQDDIWEDSKLEMMKKYLKYYDLVVSDCSIVDANLKIIENSFFELRNSGPGFLKNLYKNTYLGCCMAFNRKILKIALPFPNNIPMHDIWLGMVGEIFGSTIFIEDKLVKYRRHGNNASPTSEKSKYSLVKKIKDRYNLLIALLLRKLKGKIKK